MVPVRTQLSPCLHVRMLNALIPSTHIPKHIPTLVKTRVMLAVQPHKKSAQLGFR